MHKDEFIVFLDFDGVLNCRKSETCYFYPDNYNNGKNLDYDCWNNLRELLFDITQAEGFGTPLKVVIHSSWRNYPLSDQNVWSDGKVTLKSPLLKLICLLASQDFNVEILPHTSRQTKGEDIMDYIKKTDFDGRFVIIDDDCLQQRICEFFPDNHIVTKMDVGFTEKDADKAREILFASNYEIVQS